MVEILQRFLLKIYIYNNWLKKNSLFFIVPPFPPFNVVHQLYLCPANCIILLGQHWYGGGGRQTWKIDFPLSASNELDLRKLSQVILLPIVVLIIYLQFYHFFFFRSLRKNLFKGFDSNSLENLENLKIL